MPPSGTTCLYTSHRRRHSQFADNDSRPFCFPVPTKTIIIMTHVLLLYDSALLSGHLWSLQ